MASDHTWGRASGPSFHDCHLLGYRFPEGEGFQPTRGESYVLQDSGTITPILYKNGWYTDLWRSATGRVFVTDASGFVQTSPLDGSASWSTHSVDGMLVGVWGLDDEHVFAWGARQGKDFMLMFDGRAWTEMTSPQGGIVAMHGIRPDLVVAVGDGGLISRWDGAAWMSMTAPSNEPLRSVFVVSDDEIWCCGNRGGLSQGSVHGWTQVLQHSAPLSGVVSWRDTVWVGTHGETGICRLDGQRLESFKPKIKAAKFEAHDDALLFYNIGVVGETRDGESFKGYRTKGFAASVSGTVPPWG